MIWCFCFVFLFSTLCLQVGNRLGFWGGFSCFVSFIWCQLFACLIRAAIFRLPPAFVVWSFFLCHICVQSLSFMAFSAVGIRVRLFVFALLALVSGYQCMLLVSFILGDSNFNFFQVSYPVDSPTNSALKQTAFWYSAITFTKSHSAKCSLHKCAWLRRSIKAISFELYKFDPFSPQRVDSAGTRA